MRAQMFVAIWYPHVFSPISRLFQNHLGRSCFFFHSDTGQAKTVHIFSRNSTVV